MNLGDLIEEAHTNHCCGSFDDVAVDSQAAGVSPVEVVALLTIYLFSNRLLFIKRTFFGELNFLCALIS